MNFSMAGGPRAGNNSLSYGGRGGGALPVSPPENVTAHIHSNGIVVANFPYNTPRASSIRAFVAARLLNENNQRQQSTPQMA